MGSAQQERFDKYYRIVALRGHVGAGKSQDITFYIRAFCASDAIRQAMNMPGIKHGKFPASVVEIQRDEYINGRKESAYERANGI